MACNSNLLSKLAHIIINVVTSQSKFWDVSQYNLTWVISESLKLISLVVLKISLFKIIGFSKQFFDHLSTIGCHCNQNTPGICVFYVKVPNKIL